MLLVPTLDFDSDSLLPGVETVISALSEKPNKGLGGGGGRGGGGRVLACNGLVAHVKMLNVTD